MNQHAMKNETQYGHLFEISAPSFDKTAKLPKTRREDVVEVLHNVELIDPYQWLEDQESPATREWIKMQNDYARPVLKRFPGRGAIEKRLGELTEHDVLTRPVEADGFYFYLKREKGHQQFAIYQQNVKTGEETRLIDPMDLDKEGNVSVEIVDVSKDASLMAYAIREGGEDEVVIRVFDLKKMDKTMDYIPKGRYYGVSITPDNRGFYYTKNDVNPPVVLYHEIGDDVTGDREVFKKSIPGARFAFSLLSEDGRYLVVHLSSGPSEIKVFVKDLEKGEQFIPLFFDVKARFTAIPGGDTLFVETDWEAPNGRILAVDLKSEEFCEWFEIIPEMEDAVIENFAPVGGKLMLGYLKNVRSRILVFDGYGNRLEEVDFPHYGNSGAITGRWSEKDAFFTYSSFHVPSTIFRYDLDRMTKYNWWSPDVPVDDGIFVLKQEWYESRDGTRVPMFILHHRDMKKDGDNPLLMTGYGGFNISRAPTFMKNAVVWVENGGVFALPNLRGGGEFGEEWHRAGTFERKQNVFDDFIAAAEYLVEEGYTNPERLAVSGRSNGGLLVGAVATQKPELFRAVVCAYPLLDMLRYHKFLVGRFWVTEYGSPEDPEQFKYLLEYSPYHNVKKGADYPAMLFVTGDADTRVAPLHARKMTAIMQALGAGRKPVMLLYDTTNGHIGTKPARKEIVDATDVLSFLFMELGGR